MATSVILQKKINPCNIPVYSEEIQWLLPAPIFYHLEWKAIELRSSLVKTYSKLSQYFLPCPNNTTAGLLCMASLVAATVKCFYASYFSCVVLSTSFRYPCMITDLMPVSTCSVADYLKTSHYPKIELIISMTVHYEKLKYLKDSMWTRWFSIGISRVLGSILVAKLQHEKQLLCSTRLKEK